MAHKPKNLRRKLNKRQGALAFPGTKDRDYSELNVHCGGSALLDEQGDECVMGVYMEAETDPENAPWSTMVCKWCAKNVILPLIILFFIYAGSAALISEGSPISNPTVVSALSWTHDASGWLLSKIGQASLWILEEGAHLISVLWDQW